MTSRTTEEISFDTRNVILLDLIQYLGEKYGNKFRQSIISRDEKKKKSVMIIINGFPMNDLSAKLKNGDSIVFLLPLAGG
jgi:molybdopterin converting factor small subunit